MNVSTCYHNVYQQRARMRSLCINENYKVPTTCPTVNIRTVYAHMQLRLSEFLHMMKQNKRTSHNDWCLDSIVHSYIIM